MCGRGFQCLCAATPAVQKDCEWRPVWLAAIKRRRIFNWFNICNTSLPTRLAVMGLSEDFAKSLVDELLSLEAKV
jgi:hypothetical protein